MYLKQTRILQNMKFYKYMKNMNIDKLKQINALLLKFLFSQLFSTLIIKVFEQQITILE